MDKTSKLNPDSPSEEEDSEFDGEEYESESEIDSSEENTKTEESMETHKKKGKSVTFKEDIKNILEITEDPDKEAKEDREKKLVDYFNNVTREEKEETLEESLQRMQFEENLKYLINYLDSVKFTISPQELSHVFKTYPSILRPEVAATFLTGSNIPAVNNMIAHGFNLDYSVLYHYNRMKNEVFEGLPEKERKRLEDYYEIPDRWLKENIKENGAGVGL